MNINKKKKKQLKNKYLITVEIFINKIFCELAELKFFYYVLN